ncbi:MAG: hypothetical protein WCI74_19710, partial [Actinomycetes bacterium]
MKPYSRLGAVGMVAVPVLAAQLLLTGPAFAAVAGSVVALPVNGGHGGMRGMEDMPGMDSAPPPTQSVPADPMEGMDMGDMPGMEDTPSTAPSPVPSGSSSTDGGDMAGMDDMPGMEHSHGSGTVAAPRGDEPARNVVLAGFGVFNLLVLLIA